MSSGSNFFRTQRSHNLQTMDRRVKDGKAEKRVKGGKTEKGVKGGK